MRWLSSALWLASALVAGCTGDGELTVELAQAGFEDPAAAAESIEIRVLDDGFSEVATFADDGSGTARQRLGRLEADVSRRLEVIARDGATTIARGASRALALRAGEVREELIPFSSSGVAVALPVDRALDRAAIVDGLLDEWRASPSAVLAAGAPGVRPDLRAELLLAFDQQRLHFALLVLDDCAALLPEQPAGACGTAASSVDRVALGLDSGGDGGAFGEGDLWLEVDARGALLRHGAVEPGALELAFGLLAGGRGWVLEGALTLSQLAGAVARPGERWGFDLLLADVDPGGGEATLRWSGGERPASEPTPPAEMGALGFAGPQPQDD